MINAKDNQLPDPVILARSIRKKYGGIDAINGVSLSIGKGEIFGLLGPNGAGKSTLIRMLTTLTRPDSGDCSICGYDVVKNATEVKNVIGVVPQENNLDRDLSAYQNLRIYGMLHSVASLEKRISEALELVGLEARRHDETSGFSGGMKRRLLIARALLSDPQVLFLDEPSIGLDPQIRRQLWDIIRTAKREGRTVFITTHYIEEADALCDRVGILRKGQLITTGTPRELMSTVGEYVVERLDESGHTELHTAATREEAGSMAVCSEGDCAIRKTNLEDVFVKLTGERID